MTSKPEETEKPEQPEQSSGWVAKLGLLQITRMFFVGTLTSLVAAGLIGYLGVIGVLPVVQRYMEELHITQRMLDTVQGMRVKPMLSEKFNVLVADLDGDHRDGRNSTHVVSALVDQFDASDIASSVRVQRAHRVLRAPPAPDTATANLFIIEKGRKQLARFNADLMVWGNVARGNGEKTILRLRFLHRAGNPRNKAGTYSLGPTLELPVNFGSDLGAALAALVAADAAPAHGAHVHVVDLLQPVYKRLRPLAMNLPKALTPEQRGSILISYAAVTERLGDQLGDNGLLGESVTSYRAALAEWPNKGGWIQRQLGEVLRLLGRRELSSVRLKEAVAAERAAVQLTSRETNPNEWAQSQLSLARALREVAQYDREAGSPEEAENAFRAALEVFTRERNPTLWAKTQVELGGVLFLIGRRDRKAAPIKEGIALFREASGWISASKEPINWARLQNDLATGLFDLGKLETGTERLKEAAGSYKQALSVMTFEKLPVYWATVTISLADVSHVIGLREKNVQHLVDAEGLLRNVLSKITHQKVPRQYRRAQNELAKKLMAGGELVNGEARKARFEESLQIRERLAREIEVDEIRSDRRPGEKTAAALGEVAWSAIHAQAYDRALTASERAVSLAPDKHWLTVNRAHSLMFAGRLDEAKSLYLAQKNNVEVGKSVSKLILDDFASLRRIGITNPLMTDVEAELSSNSQTTTR